MKGHRLVTFCGRRVELLKLSAPCAPVSVVQRLPPETGKRLDKFPVARRVLLYGAAKIGSAAAMRNKDRKAANFIFVRLLGIVMEEWSDEDRSCFGGFYTIYIFRDAIFLLPDEVDATWDLGFGILTWPCE